MFLYHKVQDGAIGLHIRCLCPPEVRLQGLGIVEYIIMAGAVIAAVTVAMNIFETQIETAFTTIGTKLQAAVK